MSSDESNLYLARITADFRKIRESILKLTFEQFVSVDQQFGNVERDKADLFIEISESTDTFAHELSPENFQQTDDTQNQTEQLVVSDQTSDDLFAGVESSNSDSIYNDVIYKKYSADQLLLSRREKNQRLNLKYQGKRYLIEQLKDFEKTETEKIDLLTAKLFFKLCLEDKVYRQIKNFSLEVSTFKRLVKAFSEYIHHAEHIFKTYLSIDGIDMLQSKNQYFGDSGHDDKQDNISNQKIEVEDKQLSETEENDSESLFPKNKKLIKIINTFAELEQNLTDDSSGFNFKECRYDIDTVILYRLMFYEFNKSKLDLATFHDYFKGILESKGTVFEKYSQMTVPEAIYDKSKTAKLIIRDMYFTFLLVLIKFNEYKDFYDSDFEFFYNYYKDNFKKLGNPLLSLLSDFKKYDSGKSKLIKFLSVFIPKYSSNVKFINDYYDNYKFVYMYFIVVTVLKKLVDYDFNETFVHEKIMEVKKIFLRFDVLDIYFILPYFFRNAINKSLDSYDGLFKFDVSANDSMVLSVLDCEESQIEIYADLNLKKLDILYMDVEKF